MVDQVAVQASVAVLKRMNIDEAESGRHGLQNRVESVGRRAAIRFDHRCQQAGKIVGARADKFGQWITVMVSLAQEHAVGTETRPHKPCIFDENTVEANDFIQSEFVFARLQLGVSPALKPAARRPLAFYFETCAAVSQKHEARRARDQMRSTMADRLSSFGGKIPRYEVRQRPLSVG